MNPGHVAKDRGNIVPRTVLLRSIQIFCPLNQVSQICRVGLPVHQNQTALQSRNTRHTSGLRDNGEGLRDMTPAAIFAVAAARGFRVGLNRIGDGLMLWPGDDPPADLVNLIRGAKPEIVSVLQAERGRINRWIVSQSHRLAPDSCLHCRKPITIGQTWAVISNGEGCGALPSALSRRVAGPTGSRRTQGAGNERDVEMLKLKNARLSRSHAIDAILKSTNARGRRRWSRRASRAACIRCAFNA